MRSKAAYLSFLLTIPAILAGGCAQMRVDYQTPMFWESRDAAHERVKDWSGPWVAFTVTDLRDPASFKQSTAKDGAIVYPQESVFVEESDYAFPLAEAIADILDDREMPSEILPRGIDVCIRRYDFVIRRLDEDVTQYEVRAQYGLRPISTAPCEGELEFLHAGWAAGIFDGASEEQTKSEALAAFIDQILREYLKLSKREEPQLQPIALAIAPSTKPGWMPTEGEHAWYTYPFRPDTYFEESRVENYQSVHSAIGQMLGQLLVPDLNVSTLNMGEPAAEPELPTLVVEPVYAGLLLEGIADLHVRVTLRWNNGMVIYERELDGACIATPVQKCSLQRQIATLAESLRKEIPALLAYTTEQPPVAAEPQAPDATEPEASAN